MVDRQLMVYLHLTVAAIGQFSHDVIGCLDSSQVIGTFRSVYCRCNFCRCFVSQICRRVQSIVCRSVNKSFVGREGRLSASVQWCLEGGEVEENGKIPFLDCLVSRHDNKLQSTIYRKPTHTDRLLGQSTYNPTFHKATTIRTLTRQAQLVCDSTDSLSDKIKYLDNVFSKNNYTDPDFVKRNVYKTTNLTQRTQNLSPQR